MAEVAKNYPDKFADISGVLVDAGREASYAQGETLTLDDLRPVIDRAKILGEMDAELAQLKNTDPLNYKDKRKEVWARYVDRMDEETMAAALNSGNNIGYSVLSGARGKPAQLRAMITTPGLYTDYKDDIIPLFVRNSFSDGLRPGEYLASTFGARKAVISTKNSTAKGGDLSKLMVQAAADTVVTEEDCGTTNGLDLDVEDESLKGRVLSSPAGGLPPGTVLDKQALSELRKKGVKKVIARSAITCQSKQGVCASCVGKWFDNKFPEIGDSVGVTAATAIGEPITQQSLNTKHLAGTRVKGVNKSGFDVISRFMQSPEEFPERATVARLDGMVDAVEEAPQGGTYVTIDGEKHYIRSGFETKVQVGDKVEAGDAVSDGVVDTRDIVKYRGLGEGRLRYALGLKELLDNSGMEAKRRNTEILARSTINHMRIDDDTDLPGYLPDDLVR
jgi:DNA-directed RNA polymerase subunit beta'